ncbi:MAG: hypothetical protein EPN84_09185 [Legionella sp.]|nr:MAG: hypothetical protein EPN84_09185 [Legionella sp.]
MIIFIDPSYKDYYKNQLFNANNEVLNRDNTLAPYIRMENSLKTKNITIKTADYLIENPEDYPSGDYYSLGLLDNLDKVSNIKNIKLKSFILFEPPVVAPKLYAQLPKLTDLFETVYVHNTRGDGYSLNGVNVSKLRKLYWPQPYNTVLENYWGRTERQNRIVVINGNHKPKSYNCELYSKRIEVISHLKKSKLIDLYGHGWLKWWSRSSMWLPYFKHRSSLLSVYKGTCVSKLDTLSQYNFCLCFENMYMESYITEKIFDCFYAGTIPIYMGAKNIDELIPTKSYIDYRCFKSLEELKNYIVKLSPQELSEYKESGREFIESEEGLKYYDSISQIIQSNSLSDS